MATGELAAGRPDAAAPQEIIDLVSDDTATPPSRRPSPAASVQEYTPANGQFMLDDLMFDEFLPPPSPREDRNLGGHIVNIDGDDVFIPDELDEDLQPIPMTHNYITQYHQHQPGTTGRNLVTSDDVLEHLRNIFPNISREFVEKRMTELDGDDILLSATTKLERILEELLAEKSYPKEEKAKKVAKRKRTESPSDSEGNRWDRKHRAPLPTAEAQNVVGSILKVEFEDIPVAFIRDTMKVHNNLFPAYLALAEAQESHTEENPSYGKGRPSTKSTGCAATIATYSEIPDLMDELIAARKRVEHLKIERAVKAAKTEAEMENVRLAIESGETTECTACFDDLPVNRQIHCDGPIAHFVCYDCISNYIKAEIGDSRCRIFCTAGCGAAFTHEQLHLLSDKHLLEKLAEIQQEKDIREAELENLEECPFCDFKAIVPPVDEDFEFRCINPACETTSCRRCRSVSHVPLSCEEYAKENMVTTRHVVEEAMTAAMVRSCNKCKKQFIKEYGCNKMTCPSCGNKQCYVCSMSLRDYEHFDHAPMRGRATDNASSSKSSTKCPLYDNVEERHDQEVKKAGEQARAQVARDHPDINPEDLEIKLSDAVKKAESDRRNRPGDVLGGLHGRLEAYHNALMGGDGAFPDGVYGDEEDDEAFAAQLRRRVARRGRGAHQRAYGGAHPGGIDPQGVPVPALDAEAHLRNDLGVPPARRLFDWDHRDLQPGMPFAAPPPQPPAPGQVAFYPGVRPVLQNNFDPQYAFPQNNYGRPEFRYEHFQPHRGMPRQDPLDFALPARQDNNMRVVPQMMMPPRQRPAFAVPDYNQPTNRERYNAARQNLAAVQQHLDDVQVRHQAFRDYGQQREDAPAPQ